MKNNIHIKKLNFKKKIIFNNFYLQYLLELNPKKIIKNKLKTKILKKLLTNLQKKKFIIKLHKIDIGFLVVKYSKNIFNENVCYINDFYILKNFRKKGIAEKAIKKFIKDSKTKKIKELRLEILIKNNLANNFWNKFSLTKKSINYIIKI